MSLRMPIAVVAVLLVAGCSSPKPTAADPAAPAPIGASAAPSPSASTRTGEVGTPFDVPGWKITLTGAECGAATKVLRNGDDGTHAGRVCVASIEYVNTSPGPAQFDDSSSPDFAAFDVTGRRYEGTRWLKGPVNPGVKDSNEYVFDVADGVRITSVQIGDVVLAVAT